jgi:parvulin-like peptidyl-prolyl isomerase
MSKSTTFTIGMIVAMTCSALSPQAIAQTRTPPQQATPRAAAPQQPATTAQPAAAPRPAAAAAEDGAGVKGGEVVAQVGGSDVTAEELRAVVASLDARSQAAVARDPALLGQTVRALLANRLVLKEALSKKWEQQPAIVAQLARARENLIIESYLNSVSVPPENYPSEADIKSVYDANAGALLVPRRFQLAQIVVTLAKDADKAAEEASRKKLDDVMKKVKQPGADFGQLARSASEDAATAERNGEIGWVPEPDLRAEIRGQVIGLAKGAIAEPVRLDDGWHILKLLDTEASHTRPLSEVRDALAQRIRAERIEANRRAYMAELLKQTPPVVNEIALSRLLGTKAEAAPTR